MNGFTMKIVLVSMALFAAVNQATVAELVGVTPMVPAMDTTVVASLLGILTWLITKTIPGIIKELCEAQRDCSKEMTCEIKGLRADLTQNQSSLIGVLRETITDK